MDEASTERPARLDVVLVHRGLARSRRRAAEMVAEGRVRVCGAVASKVSQPVHRPGSVEVEPDDAPQYVSRGAHKLAGALTGIAGLAPEGLPIAGARCLDAGASTGGFTQVLLERGAACVWAVDVGHGQLSPVVAADPRVVVREGVNVRTVSTADVGDALFDLVVGDLSFISLTVVVQALVGLVRPGGDLLLLVKPQFEVGRERLGSGGVVTAPGLRQEAVLAVASSADAAGAQVRAVVPSPLPGPAGNVEYFLWMRAGDTVEAPPSLRSGQPGVPLVEAVRRAVVEGRTTSVAGSADGGGGAA